MSNILFTDKAQVTQFSAYIGNQSAYEVNNGSLVNFSCLADGNPKPVITIRNRIKQIHTDYFGNLNFLMTCEYGGIYFCDASNELVYTDIPQLNITVNVLCKHFIIITS